MSPLSPAADAGTLLVREFRSIEECAPWREQMLELNQCSPHPCPFSTLEFLERAVRHDEFIGHGRDSHVLMLAAFSGDRMMGYLPLREVQDRPLGIRQRRVGWIVTHDGDRPHLIAAAAYERPCAEVFLGHLAKRRGWSALEFANQDRTSVLREVLDSFQQREYRVRLFPANPSCTIRMQWDSIEAYFRDCAKSFRQSVARRGRHLLDTGHVEWIRSIDSVSARVLFEAYRDLERRSWKYRTNAAIERHPRRVDFYRSLLDDELPMQAKVNLLVLNDVPVAGQISGSFAGTVYGLETAYDQGVQALAPGNLTHLLMVEDCIRQRARAYNLRSLYAYHKESWLAETTETENIQIFRRRGAHHLKALLGDVRRRLRPPRTAAPGHNPAKRSAVANQTQESARADSPDQPADSRMNALRDRFRQQLVDASLVERLGNDEIRALVPWRK